MLRKEEPTRPAEYTAEDLMPSNAELASAASTIATDHVETLVRGLASGGLAGDEIRTLSEHVQTSIAVLVTLSAEVDERGIRAIRDEVSRQLAALRSGTAMTDIPGRYGTWTSNWISHLGEGYWRRVINRDPLMMKRSPINPCDL